MMCRWQIISGKYIVLVITILSTYYEFSSGFTSEILRVQLSHGGVVVGRHMTSLYGRHLRAFLGVPYAKPPIGELRFRSPVPAEPWVGERLATEDGNMCTQFNLNKNESIAYGSEDCLYLNVYTPEVPYTNKSLPILFWIHGGANFMGTGSSTQFSPKHLLERDVILVSINYRLGPLGFLSTETVDCPGNFGLKDQVLALKWVQENIENFGGDPNSVTIFGGSSGSMCVTYHTFSETTKGLFHKAIAQSGSFYASSTAPAYKGAIAERARKLANIVGCDGSDKDWANIMNCLRSVPATSITETEPQFKEWYSFPSIVFPPVVEPIHDEAYMSAPPQRTEYTNSMPLMIGFTSEEGLFMDIRFLEDQALSDQFVYRMPIIFGYENYSEEEQANITQTILDFYFPDGVSFDLENHLPLTYLFGDSFITSAVSRHIQDRISLPQNAPTYVYILEHKGFASFSEIFGNNKNYMGTCHGDELLYIFTASDYNAPTASPPKRDQELRKIMVDLWVNFATTGNPTSLNPEMPEWNAMDSYPPVMMQIGSKIENESLLKTTNKFPEARVQLWNDLKLYENKNSLCSANNPCETTFW